MPKRTDIRTILIIGSGPIVIGQGTEFDYSGTQACKALREEGYQVVLINSNPATIMTDPEMADRTYIEPITPEAVAKIIEKERGGSFHIDALLPTLGGQTALNTACRLYDEGVLEKYGVEMIGANREVIYRAEDRKIFKEIVESIGLAMPRARIANSMDEAWQILEAVGLPAIIRPAFTLGGTGGGIAYNREEFEDIVRRGLDASMTSQILIDQSVIGWKEYELEVMRDQDDNVVIICSIENVDPMGVHTGDSITVAPAQTLTDREYQRMRDAAIAIIRAVGVETGGCNIQFAINPSPENDEGEMVVVEMNPRVSRSSALASKATGFAIAKIAAKLAVGYTLWELPNDITRKTVACFEPTIDYVVTKIPRWTFEKFPEADETLTTQMKSVGEAMSIGRTFKESLQKGIRSMEVKRFGLGLDDQDKWLRAMRLEPSTFSRRGQGEGPHSASGEEKAGPSPHFRGPSPSDGRGGQMEWPIAETKLRRKLSVPSQGRLYYIRYAFKMGWSIDEVYALTKIDRWFLDQIRQLVTFEDVLCEYQALEDVPREVLFEAKQLGYSDAQLAKLYLGKISAENILRVRRHRQSLSINPVYKLVDTCAAEFEAATPYYYSTYERPFVEVGNAGGSDGATQRPSDEGKRQASDAAQRRVEVASPVCYMSEIEDADTAPPSSGSSAPTVAPSLRRSVASVDDEIRITPKPKMIILGGGPNRIGQGIEFDYCCVQAAFAAREMGLESVMINSNPETVSTDYDTSDLLFFEPLTLEDVLNVVERLNVQPLAGAKNPPAEPGAMPAPAAAGAVHGVIVQFGGQTPLNLAHGLKLAGVPIIGTSVDSIDLAEDRNRFAELIKDLGIRQPVNGIAHSIDEAVQIANRIGYPVLVRPSFVLGGRAMETVFDDDQLRYYMNIALGASDLEGQPILIDDFLAEAIECDVDVIGDFPEEGTAGSGTAGSGTKGLRDKGTKGKSGADCSFSPSVPQSLSPSVPSAEQRDKGTKGKNDSAAFSSPSVPQSLSPSVPSAIICGVMEHIEEAGIHSGDSACAIPPYSLPPRVVERLKEQSRKLAEALAVRGLMNVQWAITRPNEKNGADYEIYVLEVNPRASRTVPFVSKATGVSWARIAAKVMAGHSLDGLGVTQEVVPEHTSVKESVFPFSKFPGVDVVLGPEMRSTGEVMGIDPGFPIAFAKSQMAAGTMLPTQGNVFVSVRESDKPHIVEPARRLREMGFTLISTAGTHDYLARHGVETRRVNKISEGRPNAVDLIKNRELALIINTPSRKGIATDEGRLRSTAVRFNVPMITTTTGAAAAVQAIAALREEGWGVRALQDYFPSRNGAVAVEPEPATQRAR